MAQHISTCGYHREQLVCHFTNWSMNSNVNQTNSGDSGKLKKKKHFSLQRLMLVWSGILVLLLVMSVLLPLKNVKFWFNKNNELTLINMLIFTLVHKVCSSSPVYISSHPRPPSDPAGSRSQPGPGRGPEDYTQKGRHSQINVQHQGLRFCPLSWYINWL